MSEILTAAPGLAGAGAGGLLLLLVMYLVKANRDDRIQHRETVAALTAEHRQEDADVEAKIARLEKRIDELQRLVDDERDLRRAAQDRAARAESEAATLRQATGASYDPATTRLAPPPLGGLAPGANPLEDGDGPGGWYPRHGQR